MSTRIDIPTCACVKAARKRPGPVPVPARYETEGTATASDLGTAVGWVAVRCGYCGSYLKAVPGVDFTKPIELRDETHCETGNR